MTTSLAVALVGLVVALGSVGAPALPSSLRSPWWGHAGPYSRLPAFLHAFHHFQQLVHCTHNLLPIPADPPDDIIQIGPLIVREPKTRFPQRV
jgi:hypothetical protein